MNDVVAWQNAGEIVVPPSTTFLSASAALNWIAFRRAEDGDLTGRVQFWREFGYAPCRPASFNVLDYAAAEAVDKLTPSHHARMRDFITRMGKEPRDLEPARRAFARMVAERGWGASGLYVYMEGWRQLWMQRSDRLWAAQCDLTDALAAEKIIAYATRATATEAEWVYPSLHAVGTAAAVPWQFFLTPGAVVEPSGAIRADSDPGYLHAQFRTAEVLRAWPGPDCEELLVNCPTPSVQHCSTAAAEWMRLNVTEPGQWKRDSALKQCRADTKATYRSALAAWNELPDDLRGSRGAHK